MDVADFANYGSDGLEEVATGAKQQNGEHKIVLNG